MIKINEQLIADHIVNQMNSAENARDRTKVWMYARSISTATRFVRQQLYYWFADSSCYNVTMDYILGENMINGRFSEDGNLT